MLIGWSILLIIHGILAVFLLGAITHQAVGAAWPVAKRAPGFFNALRSVNGMSYTNAVMVLFVVTFIIGTIIYPTYRVNVRTVLQEYHDYKPEGSFELKEHFLSLGLMLLPAYWFFWRRPSEQSADAGRRHLHSRLRRLVGIPRRPRHQQHPGIRFMTKFERVFPIFGVIFAVVYTYAVYKDIALVTYHPKIGVWDIGRTASRDGPAMYWYGFVLLPSSYRFRWPRCARSSRKRCSEGMVPDLDGADRRHRLVPVAPLAVLHEALRRRPERSGRADLRFGRPVSAGRSAPSSRGLLPPSFGQ